MIPAIPLAYIFTLGFGASALGWYWAKAAVFKPLREPVHKKALTRAGLDAHLLMRHESQTIQISDARAKLLGVRLKVLRWFLEGWSCRLCVGQWAAVLGHWFLTGVAPWDFSRVDWWIATAANGVHIAIYQAAEISGSIKVKVEREPRGEGTTGV